MKVLLAVDGSSYTKRMLAYMAAHDEWLGGRHEYTVLHCVTQIPHRAAAFATPDQVRTFYEDDAHTVLRPIRDFFSAQGLHADFRFHVGVAGKHIAEVASHERFDLVMLGSHGHGAVMNVILGSVATQVIALCSTPVLLIR